MEGIATLKARRAGSTWIQRMTVSTQWSLGRSYSDRIRLGQVTKARDTRTAVRTASSDGRQDGCRFSSPF